MFEQSPFNHFRTELISLSNESMYCFTQLVDLKEYEYCMVKLIRFIHFYQKIVVCGLLPKLQANSIAQYTEGLGTALPDLKDDYLNRLKTLAIEEAIKITNLTQIY